MRTKILVNRALSAIIAALFIGALFTRCANIGSPSGGPFDTLPPVIVAMTPDNFTTEMDIYTRRIYIEFDEFVQLKDQQTEFFTSPQLKTKPQLSTRGRGVVVTLRDTLLKNTTYALNFGSSIQDNNESNPLYSMRYVFSTGKTIDSLILSGYAEDSFKADSVSKAFVMLYPADSVTLHSDYDSTLFNKKPAVIARAENNGIFMAQNLKAIPYYLYAMEDTNGNLTYEPGTDRVGFIDGTYNPAEMEEFTVWYDSLRRYVVADPQTHFRLFLDTPFKRQLLTDSERPLQHKAMLYFGAPMPQIDSLLFDSLSMDQIIVEPITKGRDTLALWFNAPAEQIPDTLRGRIVYFKHDSINQLTRVSENLTLSWRFVETKEQEQERERQEREKKKAENNGEEWVEPEVENPFKVVVKPTKSLNPEKSITLDFDYPLSHVDSAAITLQYLSQQAVVLRATLGDAASTARGNSVPYTLQRDSVNVRRWHINTEWGEPGSEYFLTLNKGSLTDIAGFSNDSLSYVFTPLDKEDFATIIVNIAEDEETPSSYIIDLMSSDGKTITERKVGLSAGEVVFNYVAAGNVSMRVIQDINGNGEWDSGDLVKRQQPERIQFIERDGSREIATKENWEIEIDIDPATLFAPESQAQLIERLDRQEAQRLEKLNKTKEGDKRGGSESHDHDHQH